MRNKVLAVKHERKKPLERHRLRMDENFKMDLKEIVFDGLDWIHLAHDTDPLVVCEQFHKLRGIS
jgi:hypothetical protein